MANKTPRSWIVLLNKVPHGPLSEAQVRALINEGHLRHNDIAYEVRPKPEGDEVKVNSEWKLLWQFPEFDRRNEPDVKTSWAGTATPPSAEKVLEERRKEVNETEVKARARGHLPPEMLDIAPEELVVHSTTAEPLFLAAQAEERIKASFEVNLPSAKVLWALGGMLLLLVTVGLYRSKGKAGSFQASRDTAPPPARDTGSSSRAIPAARAPSRAPSRLMGAAIPRPVSPRAPEARVPANTDIEERERDRGEVDRPSDEETYEDENGEEVRARPRAKIRPPSGNRRSRVLSDEAEEGDDNGDSPPPDEE